MAEFEARELSELSTEEEADAVAGYLYRRSSDMELVLAQAVGNQDKAHEKQKLDFDLRRTTALEMEKLEKGDFVRIKPSKRVVWVKQAKKFKTLFRVKEVEQFDVVVEDKAGATPPLSPRSIGNVEGLVFPDLWVNWGEICGGESFKVVFLRVLVEGSGGAPRMQLIDMDDPRVEGRSLDVRKGGAKVAIRYVVMVPMGYEFEHGEIFLAPDGTKVQRAWQVEWVSGPVVVESHYLY
ncbi:unnamed protein product [Closterium sp. Naga37s-1]|nr:unnamed protein product [Closterium sp. Naga37s-1]